MSKETMRNFRQKKEAYRTWKGGRTTWDRDVVRVCRDVTRRAKASLEFNLTRRVKDNKKGFFRCKRKTRKNVDQLVRGLWCSGNKGFREGSY